MKIEVEREDLEMLLHAYRTIATVKSELGSKRFRLDDPFYVAMGKMWSFFEKYEIGEDTAEEWEEVKKLEGINSTWRAHG